MMMVVVWVEILFVIFSVIILVLGNPGDQLVFSNKKDIRRFNFGLQNYTLILGGLEYVRSLDYDYKDGLLFFISVHNNEKTVIHSSSFVDRNAQPKVVVDTVIQLDNDLKCLAVDWLSKKLYYTDLEKKRVVVSNYDGSLKKVIVSDGLNQPEGLALFPQKGLMFVTDWGSFKKIERFEMDGSNRKIIYNDDSTGWGRSITIDYSTSLIYWGDTVKKVIAAMTIDGKIIKIYQLQHSPNYLSVATSMLFWSDGAAIYGLFKTNGTKTIHLNNFNGSPISPNDVRVFESYRQPKVSTSCDVNNGGCSHLCLLKSNGYVCTCPTGIALKEDNKTCEDGMKKFLVIARKENIRLVSFDADENVDFRLNIDKKYTRAVHGVVYDVELKRLYWSDSGCPQKASNTISDCTHPGSINSIFINGTGFQQLLSKEIQDPDHLAVDWIARNIYWTDGVLGRIEVARLDGTSRKIIISENLQRPRGLALDTADSKIYWSDWGNNSKIESADLNGDNRQILVDKGTNWPNGIALDPQHRRLYWVDAKKYSISYIELNTKVIRTIFQKASHPFGIAIFGKYAYWTDWSRRVTRLNLAGKKNQKEKVILNGISDVMGICAVDTNIKYGTNPCYYKTNNCSHFCFVKPAIAHALCECPKNMELGQDERTCQTPSGFMIFSTKNDIRKVSVDTFKYETRLLKDQKTNHPLFDVDFERQKIVWYVEEPQGEFSSIRSAGLNGSDSRVLMEVETAKYDSFALDWISGNIYVAKAHHIEVVSMKGTFQKKLIFNEDLMNPRCVMVNPNLRKLYWIQKKNGSFLFQSNLDGSDIVELRQMNPDICSIEFATGVIYCLTNQRKLVAFNPAQKVTTIIRSYISKWTSLIVFQNNVIFTDYSNNMIGRIPVDPGQTKPEELLRVEHPFNAKILHPDVQIGTNRCFHNNGGCQHFCFAITTIIIRCGCATHYTLHENGRDCIEPQSFLLVRQKNHFLRILFSDGVPDYALPITTGLDIGPMAYDFLRGFVYWMDGVTKVVHRAHQNGSGADVVIDLKKSEHDSSPGEPFDFALDPFSNSFFWTDKKKNTICFLNTLTQSKGVVFSKKGFFPRKIVAYPEIGRLFWTSVDESETRTELMSITFAGTDSQHLRSLDRSVIGDLVIDHSSKLLYYLDTEKNKIVSLSLKGQEQFKTPIETKFNPVSIATNNKDIFWADRNMIYKVSKAASTQNSVVFHGRYDALSEIIAVNTSRKNFSHPCIEKNGGCSHICRISYRLSLSSKKNPPTAICGCPINYILTTDLKNCSVVEMCTINQVFCKEDSRCIDYSLQCDGKNDCSDGQDEEGTICEFPKPPCTTSYKRCGQANMCVKEAQWCDGTSDCPNSEDEATCNKCDSDHFACGGRCVSVSARCNGESDCRDLSDEKGCPAVTDQPSVTVVKIAQSKGSNSTILIITAVVISIVVILVGMVFYRKYINSKKNTSNAPVGGAWTLHQLKPLSSSDAKSSVSTYISNDLSYYDRNNMTGQSDVCDSEFSKLILNPPPSPVTERAMSTMSADARNNAFYKPYSDSDSRNRCDMCHHVIDEESIVDGMGGGRDAPPPTVVSALDEVDLYFQSNIDWSQKSTICEDCQSSVGSTTQASEQVNGRLHNGNRHSRSRTNGHLRSIHENMSDLETSWMYDDAQDENQYGEEPLFIDNNVHLFDPPPSPCTYLSEEDRPPSPVFSALHGRERHFAPPPSPTSQLL